MGTKIWWLAIGGCGIAVLYMISAIFGSYAVPERTEIATLAIAFAVVPYCLVQALLRLFGDRS